MLSDTMAKAINEQINKEMYSGYLYMAMSANSTDMGLDGFAKWFMVQYHEEMFHAMKMYEYLADQGAKVVLETIEKPRDTWKTPMEMVKETYEHEQTVTASIHNLMLLAKEENDFASMAFLEWYVTEQVEEEKSAQDIINRLKLAGEGPGLFMIDKELGSRSLSVPSDFSAGLGGEE
ncbi:MAG: ferritin [Spirochaetales bacterium]|nr:ferritin [Spirochaetales bacterium]